MKLYIYQKPDQLTFTLKKKKRVIKKEIYRPKKELSKEFLSILDKFLKKIKVEVTEIKSFKLRQSKDVGFTAKRVIRAIKNALNFAASITP